MKVLLAIAATLMLLAVVSCAVDLVMTPINGAVGVYHKTFDPAKMLSEYHYFHSASETINGMPARIKSAKQAVEDARSDKDGYTEARRTELTGLEATCVQLVNDYNAKAGQMDTGFLQNPERYLPLSAAGYTPLPVTVSMSVCE